MNIPVHDFLSCYDKKDIIRCHTPGHKGSLNGFDITEINGSDSLYDCNSIIFESEKNAAMLYGAADTFYSCQGSTLSIQTMLAAVKFAAKKTKIIANRFSHRSLISSAILLGFDIDWVYPSENFSSKIDAFDLKQVTTKDTAAVFVTNIDYYGNTNNIKEISEITEKYNIPLLVDNAHGAYLVFTDEHPIKNGAFLSADSTHKTLPALTGTAYLHSNGYFNRETCKNAMSLFGSSSPSYLFLESLDLCNKFIYENKNKAIQTFQSIADLKNKLKSAGFVLKHSDRLRVTIDVNSAGYTGAWFAKKIENEIECEFKDDRYIVLLFSALEKEGIIEKVYNTLTKVKIRKPLHHKEIPIIKPTKFISPMKAFFEKKKSIPIKEARGKICAEIVAPCPPGIPLIIPGEIIDDDITEILSLMGYLDLQVIV